MCVQQWYARAETSHWTSVFCHTPINVTAEWRTSDVRPLEHVLGRRRQRTEFERLADQFAPLFRAQKGFKSVTFFEADAAAGEYGSFSLWDTREDAEAADAALRPQLRQAVSGLGLQMQGTPIRRIGEAYEPKA